MKSNKVLLIVQTILMYVAHIPFYIALLLIKLVPDMSLDNVIIGLLLSGIILSAIILPFCIVNGIMALISLFKDFESPIKLTLKLKLILIPWYIMNFIICILLSAGFLNPWLLIAWFFVVFILICITYIIMVTLGLPLVAYLIRKMSKKEIETKPSIIVGIVFQFIFCLDVLGVLIIHLKTRKLDL